MIYEFDEYGERVDEEKPKKKPEPKKKKEYSALAKKLIAKGYTEQDYDSISYSGSSVVVTVKGETKTFNRFYLEEKTLFVK